MKKAPGIVQYKDLKALQEMVKNKKLEAIASQKGKAEYSLTENIPGTIPEKMVYDYLTRLRLNFNFQYHLMENAKTQYTESNWIPDFILPDYHNTLIEVYGTYWHQMSRISDQEKKMYWQTAGYTIVERGIPLASPRNSNGGKVVIWWEEEIYNNLSKLFTRDLPEIFTYYVFGKPSAYTLDPIEQFRKTEAMRKRLLVKRIKPKRAVMTPKYKKFKMKSK
jgi:G:T-mismatch repair DNA endonuclease (very short patch repair protein)